ncbi:mucin-2-like [Clytia hemisphaerica]|uniref:EGF-like domain-containing protein n=1 Tax=Clytia hemisphaerica TaxID=252671 RepID=A0A7M6DRJ4_9CNID
MLCSLRSGENRRIEHNSWGYCLSCQCDVMPTSDANTHQSIREITNATSQVCGTECYRATSCWSFLLFRHKTAPTCTLIDGSIDRRHMTKNSTVDYYEVWNQCSSNDTICNLGVCLPNYVTDSFTCHCPSSYTGANCETEISQPTTPTPTTTDAPTPTTTDAPPTTTTTEAVVTETATTTENVPPISGWQFTSNAPVVLFTYPLLPTTWSFKVHFTFQTPEKRVSFFQINYNNQGEGLFSLVLAGAGREVAFQSGGGFDYIKVGGDRFAPVAGSFYSVVCTCILNGPRSIIQYTFKDDNDVSIQQSDDFTLTHPCNLNDVTFHNGNDADHHHSGSGFNGKMWTSGIHY